MERYRMVFVMALTQAAHGAAGTLVLQLLPRITRVSLSIGNII